MVDILALISLSWGLRWGGALPLKPPTGFWVGVVEPPLLPSGEYREGDFLSLNIEHTTTTRTRWSSEFRDSPLGKKGENPKSNSDVPSRGRIAEGAASRQGCLRTPTFRTKTSCMFLEMDRIPPSVASRIARQSSCSQNMVTSDFVYNYEEPETKVTFVRVPLAHTPN